ncbi:hypothetical protein H6P81_001945 [Aristolochia fimbriata]|uniref:ARM repeat superfamily protein n=1 Tax=Aristolochia fimbriata TaxID=158543 RepID=A0AAV7FBL2_ARIFI|nr:hypothetical protein H6P81_001945 [Aristolochia fimbriata]
MEKSLRYSKTKSSARVSPTKRQRAPQAMAAERQKLPKWLQNREGTRARRGYDGKEGKSKNLQGMELGSSSSNGGGRSVHVQIIDEGREDEKLSSVWGSTVFDQQRETPESMEGRDINNNNSAPEKKLTLFALRLAILEKSASGLGTLGFIWATVVLLGGFAITLDKKDFWFITTILLIEGARIFSRSHELEWQHQATWSLADAGRFSFRALKSSSNFLIRTLGQIFRLRSATEQEPHRAKRAVSRNLVSHDSDKRKWVTPEVPLLPFVGWIFLSKNISRLLYWLQLVSASACVCLSLIRLIEQDYGEISKGDSDKRNRKSALNIFYGLALAEAFLFLMERAYWEWEISYCKLLEKVTRECRLGNSGLVSIKRFFYDAYSRCVNGSIFDGLKMDLVSFAAELMESDSLDEQLTGVRIMKKFVNDERFAEDTLRKIGTSIGLIERLLEMLNWQKPQEEEMRKSAAEIVSKLAGKNQNALRVAGIPGAMESIASLLYTGKSSKQAAPDEVVTCEKMAVVAGADVHYEFSAFNLLGLLILKKLARDVDNCEKIGSTRGLLPKIIDFTQAVERLPESQIKTVMRSLQLVKMLVSTSGATGKTLRQNVSEIVFTISNIREILQSGETHTALQILGIEILTCLALEVEAKETIGRTGGVLKQLARILFNERPVLPHDQTHRDQNPVKMAAGEALAMLALESERNCDQILRLGVLDKLVQALRDPLLATNAARIIRNLCAYRGSDCFHRLKGVSAATPTVLRAIMSEENNKLQEIAIGLAAEILKFTMSLDETDNINQSFFQLSGISETELAEKLVQVLKKYQYPSTKVPRIRRFSVELAIWMMRSDEKTVPVFRRLGMEKELEKVAETTSELECFNVFSGSVGLSRNSTTVHSLVDAALDLLANN